MWIVVAGVGALVLVLAWVCYRRMTTKPVSGPGTKRVLVVLGSGGHTAEMLAMCSSLDQNRYQPVWVVADTDKTSLPRLQREKKLGLLNASQQSTRVIPRSREVGQSWLSTLFTTAKASWFAVQLVWDERPDLVLLNGPGTGVPILLGAMLLRVWLGGRPGSPKIIFIESFCRVDSLSMTGKICYPVVDRFIVQWPQLLQAYPRAEYLGVIF
ncbi:hypothetical protein BASA81_002612 [Batrachochytrium salamandrivorans]|nr:hypothetical protein BASA81_002612 [Batrachochytrium salamandrivorans]